MGHMKLNHEALVYDFMYAYCTNTDDTDNFIDEFCLSDIVYQTSLGRVLGGQGLKSHKNRWFTFFQPIDFKLTDKIIVDDNFLTFHFSESFKQIDNFQSIPTTGKTVKHIGAANFMLDEGKILKFHISGNIESVIAQLLDGKPRPVQGINQVSVVNQYHQFSKDVIYKLNSLGIKLTLRQLECLSLWVIGKSDTEIANIMELSKKTVQYHQDRIKLIFTCYTKHELFEKIKALKLGHIMNECAYLLMGVKLSHLSKSKRSEDTLQTA